MQVSIFNNYGDLRRCIPVDIGSAQPRSGAFLIVDSTLAKNPGQICVIKGEDAMEYMLRAAIESEVSEVEG